MVWCLNDLFVLQTEEQLFSLLKEQQGLAFYWDTKIH